MSECDRQREWERDSETVRERDSKQGTDVCFLQVSKDELDWSTNELRNCLRAIDWDLEDLHETISILATHRHLSLFPCRFLSLSHKDTDTSASLSTL